MTKTKNNAMEELYLLFKNGNTGKYLASFSQVPLNDEEDKRNNDFFNKSVMLIPKAWGLHLSELEQTLPRTNWYELRKNYLADGKAEQTKTTNSQDLEAKATRTEINTR